MTLSRVRPKKAPVRIAIIGTGSMAAFHAKAFQAIEGCEIVGATDPHPDRLDAFCHNHKIPQGYSTFEALIDKSGCNAVCIVTPDRFHAPLSIASLEKGMHVLCEKPLSVSFKDGQKMVRASKTARRVNVVNFSYRNWAALHGLHAAVASGKVGKLRHIEASYLQSWIPSKVWGDWRESDAWLWRMSSQHSKGVLGDIGVHLFDFVTYVAGPIKRLHCRMQTFPKAPSNKHRGYTLDANDSIIVSAELGGGALCTLHASRWASGHQNRISLKIHGSHGAVSFDSDISHSSFRICTGEDLHTANWREISCPAVPTNFERFAEAIRSGKRANPDFTRGALIDSLTDACFASVVADASIKV